jgi:hypothetical protein
VPPSPENLHSSEENVNTIRGRQSIINQIHKTTKAMNEDQKMKLLDKLCGSGSQISLTPVELFKIYHVIRSFNS